MPRSTIISVLAFTVGCGVPTSTEVEVELAARTATLRSTETADPMDEGTLANCRDLLGGVDVTRVTGNQQTVTLDETGALAIKVTGNRNTAWVELVADAGTTTGTGTPGTTVTTTTPGGPSDLGGLCVRLSGNQAVGHVVVDGLALSSLAIVATGNQPSVAIEVLGSASVDEVALDVRGNQPGGVDLGRWHVDLPGGGDPRQRWLRHLRVDPVTTHGTA